MGKRCITTASTGIAATVLPCGRTWHSLWKLPIPVTSVCESGVKRSPELIATDVIILDEAPMTTRFALEAADRKLRELRRCNLPFGGAILILGEAANKIIVIASLQVATTVSACLSRPVQ